MYKVSVVIPVYNDEKYLPKALESIEKQTIGFENIEVIIVSDGSIDNTDNIIKNFIYNKTNCKFIKNNIPSGSAGLPRNLGIKNATGEYIMFLDSDDFFENDAVEKMYNAIKDTEYKCVTTNYKLVDAQGKDLNKLGFSCDFYKKELILEDLLVKNIYCNGAVWNKIFDLKFIKQIKCECLSGAYAEDLYFTMCCFLESKKILFVPEIISVNYRNTENSASKSINYRYFERMNNGYLRIYNKFKEYDKEEFCKMILAEAKVFFITQLINSEKIDSKEFIEIVKNLKWYFIFIKDVKFGNENGLVEEFIQKVMEEKYDELLKMSKCL